jgi:hypothetical protein
MKKFGRTALFAVFILIFVLGATMMLKVAAPSIRKVSPSLGDILA